MKVNFSTLTEDGLIEYIRGSRDDSEKAFTVIYKRYAAIIHAYCACMINNHQQVEDIFQDTLIKFYQNVRNDGRKINIRGYLITIARNLCLNYRRDRKLTVPIENMESIIETHQPNERTELLELMTMALNLLDFDYREAFVLREIDGFSYEQIAKVCDISVANARKRAFRARKKMKDILNPYFSDVYS